MSAAPKAGAGGLAPGEFEAVATLLRRAGSRFESEIRGCSMAPTIANGARVRIGPAAGGEHCVGDIVACVIGGALFTPRIIFRDPASGIVLTRGDGWILCDPPTPPHRIVGTVCEHHRDGVWRTPAPA